jgi:hypothetical protein
VFIEGSGSGVSGSTLIVMLSVGGGAINPAEIGPDTFDTEVGGCSCRVDDEGRGVSMSCSANLIEEQHLEIVVGGLMMGRSCWVVFSTCLSVEADLDTSNSWQVTSFNEQLVS